MVARGDDCGVVGEEFESVVRDGHEEQVGHPGVVPPGSENRVRWLFGEMGRQDAAVAAEDDQLVEEVSHYAWVRRYATQLVRDDLLPRCRLAIQPAINDVTNSDGGPCSIWAYLILNSVGQIHPQIQLCPRRRRKLGDWLVILCSTKPWVWKIIEAWHLYFSRPARNTQETETTSFVSKTCVCCSKIPGIKLVSGPQPTRGHPRLVGKSMAYRFLVLLAVVASSFASYTSEDRDLYRQIELARLQIQRDLSAAENASDALREALDNFFLMPNMVVTIGNR